MKINISGTSIVESMIVMLIIVTGITGMYSIFTQSQRLSETTWNRIEAIQIAREWIEAFTNIRNTNWILFAADYKNCWNTLNYNNACIWDVASTDIADNGSYIIYQDSNNRWVLAPETTWNYSDSTYRDDFQVFQYNHNSPYTWLYTQSGSVNEIESMNPVFTREIQIEYIEDTNWLWWITSDDEKMRITSRVEWLDSAKSTPHSIELETILTNWKNKAN